MRRFVTAPWKRSRGVYPVVLASRSNAASWWYGLRGTDDVLCTLSGRGMMSTDAVYALGGKAEASIVAKVVQTRSQDKQHVPVMPEEVLQLWVNTERAGASKERGEYLYFVDATAGHGGHTEMLLRLYPNAVVLCIERDPQALAQARRYIAQSQEDQEAIQRVYFYNGSFANIERAIEATDFPSRKMDGVFFDFGLNSSHIDSADRGFSYRRDSTLDMRYNLSVAKNEIPPAQDLLYRIDYNSLRDLLRERGEIDDFAEEIAAAIVRWRGKGSKRRKIRSTLELRFVIERALDQVLSRQAKKTRALSRKQQFTANSSDSLFIEKASHWNSKVKRERALSQLVKAKPRHPLTVQKVFQALRLAVNDEEYHIVQALSKCPRLLAEGGRLVCMSFSPHEDAFVRNLFRVLNLEGNYWKELTVNVAGGNTIGSSQVETTSYLRPRRAEVRHNSRARSAHLRCMEKTASSTHEDQPVSVEEIGLTAVHSRTRSANVDNDDHANGPFNVSIETWSEEEDDLVNQLRQDVQEAKIRFVSEFESSDGANRSRNIVTGRNDSSSEFMKQASSGKRFFSTNNGSNGSNGKDSGILDSIIDDTIDKTGQADAPLAEEEDIKRLKETLDQSESLRERYQSMLGKADMDLDDNTEANMRRFAADIGIDLNQPDLSKLSRILKATGVPEQKQHEAWDSASQEVMDILRRRAKKELGLSSETFNQLLQSLNRPNSSEHTTELLDALEAETSHTTNSNSECNANRESARILAGKLANVDPPSPTQLEDELPYMEHVMSQGEKMELPAAFTEAGITLDNIHQFSEQEIESVLNSIDPEDDHFSGITWEEAISLEEQGRTARPERRSPTGDQDGALQWEWDAEEDQEWQERKKQKSQEDETPRSS
eukprot:gb/GECG01011190.1/.p1 GENE.gb/GECG01011190.1/~~gb/GECG01011190.1/.p1  ORF type:complete len:887 (+),score=132.80 gb/GECG01011190.1/:1-2661(+)